jgi:hypothetical protein
MGDEVVEYVPSFDKGESVMSLLEMLHGPSSK